MAKFKFQVYNVTFGEPIAAVEMDEELLKPEAGMLDGQTMTLRPLKKGAHYTIVPMEDATVLTLKNVRRAYLNVTNKPAPHFSSHIGRIDNLLDAIGALFGEAEYVIIETVDDMAKLIDPPKDYEPHKVTRSILGDLLQRVLDEDSFTGIENAQPTDGNQGDTTPTQ